MEEDKITFNKINEWSHESLPDKNALSNVKPGDSIRIKYKRELTPIRIVGQSDINKVIEFSNPEEFNEYYNDHRDLFEKKTTQTLNAKYKIKGYVITQLKNDNGENEVCLRKDYLKAREERIDVVELKLSALETKINKMEKAIVRICEWINQNS